MSKKEVKTVNVHIYDVEELACKILGIDYEEIDADTDIIDEELLEAFGLDLYVFRDIISKLLPLVDKGESPITGEKYKGFADNNMWLTKVKIHGDYCLQDAKKKI